MPEGLCMCWTHWVVWCVFKHVIRLSVSTCFKRRIWSLLYLRCINVMNHTNGNNHKGFWTSSLRQSCRSHIKRQIWLSRKKWSEIHPLNSSLHLTHPSLVRSSELQWRPGTNWGFSVLLKDTLTCNWREWGSNWLPSGYGMTTHPMSYSQIQYNTVVLKWTHDNFWRVQDDEQKNIYFRLRHASGLSSFEDRQEWHFHQHLPPPRRTKFSDIFVSLAQFQDALFSLVAGLHLTQIRVFFLIGYCVAHFFFLIGG